MDKPINKMSKDELRDYLNTPEGRTIVEDIKKIMREKHSQQNNKSCNKYKVGKQVKGEEK